MTGRGRALRRSDLNWVTFQPVTTLWTQITTVISCKSDRKHRIDLTVKKLLNLTEGVNLRIAPQRLRVSCVLVISRRANCWAGWNRVHGNCASSRQFNRARPACRLTLIPWYGCLLLPVRLYLNEPLYFNWNEQYSNYWAVKSPSYFRDFQTCNTPLRLMRWSAYQAELDTIANHFFLSISTLAHWPSFVWE